MPHAFVKKKYLKILNVLPLTVSDAFAKLLKSSEEWAQAGVAKES